MPDEQFDKFPIFNNLRTLSVGSHGEKDESFVREFTADGRFLQKCPNLEKLTLLNWAVGELNTYLCLFTLVHKFDFLFI